ALSRCGVDAPGVPELTQFVQVGGEWIPDVSPVPLIDRPPMRQVLAKRTGGRRVCHDRGVTTALIYRLVKRMGAGVGFRLGSLVVGRGEGLAAPAAGN